MPAVRYPSTRVADVPTAYEQRVAAAEERLHPTGEFPIIAPAAGQAHGPGADLYRIEWSGRPWRSWPRIVEATKDERRCINPDCRRTYPCEGFRRRSSWPY